MCISFNIYIPHDTNRFQSVLLSILISDEFVCCSKPGEEWRIRGGPTSLSKLLSWSPPPSKTGRLNLPSPSLDHRITQSRQVHRLEPFQRPVREIRGGARRREGERHSSSHPNRHRKSVRSQIRDRGCEERVPRVHGDRSLRS